MKVLKRIIRKVGKQSKGTKLFLSFFAISGIYVLVTNIGSTDNVSRDYYQLEECYLAITVGDLTSSTRVIAFGSDGFNQIGELVGNYKVDNVYIEGNDIVIKEEFRNTERVLVNKEGCNIPRVTFLKNDEEIIIK